MEHFCVHINNIKGYMTLLGIDGYTFLIFAFTPHSRSSFLLQ